MNPWLALLSYFLMGLLSARYVNNRESWLYKEAINVGIIGCWARWTLISPLPLQNQLCA